MSTAPLPVPMSLVQVLVLNRPAKSFNRWNLPITFQTAIPGIAHFDVPIPATYTGANQAMLVLDQGIAIPLPYK